MPIYHAADPLLCPKEAATYLNLSVDWLARERWKGTGPGYVRLSGGRFGAIRYRRSALDAYVAAHTIDPRGGL